MQFRNLIRLVLLLIISYYSLVKQEVAVGNKTILNEEGGLTRKKEIYFGVLIFLVLLFSVVPSYADEPVKINPDDITWDKSPNIVEIMPFEIMPWYGNGKGFIETTEFGKKAVSLGLINGLMMAPAFGAPKYQFAWFETCVEPMSIEQIVAILKRFLDDHPERWHEPLGALAHASLLDACPNSPKKQREK